MVITQNISLIESGLLKRFNGYGDVHVMSGIREIRDDNTPMQCSAILNGCKKDTFQLKMFDVFFFFFFLFFFAKKYK